MGCVAVPDEDDRICGSLQVILRGLVSVLGGWGLAPGVVFLVHRRIGRVGVRLAGLLARFRAGTLRVAVPVVRAAGDGDLPGLRSTPMPTPTRVASGVAGSGVPRRFGWLVRAGGYQAAGYGSQLQHLFAEPEMAALLAACPAAVRLVRPLCRALAVELDWVRGVRGACSVRTVTPRASGGLRGWGRGAQAEFRIPLPRGVLSAARRGGRRGLG